MAVSIRSVASACGVSVGSIYNYFDSKAELITATVESVWCEIFHRPEDDAVFQDVQTCITWMYGRMAYGCTQYPGFFNLHSLGFMREEKMDGKRRMQQTWQHILAGLCTVLKQDAQIRPGALRRNSHRKNLPMCCFRSCCPLCCSRIMIPAPCWRSCAEHCIEQADKFPPKGGNFISGKVNIVH